MDYADRSITENTRVSYPIYHIDNARWIRAAQMEIQKYFFLTCDAYGILPPISRLTPEQAMYYFISGYTARVAGTEVGVKNLNQLFRFVSEPFPSTTPCQVCWPLGKSCIKQPTRVCKYWLEREALMAIGKQDEIVLHQGNDHSCIEWRIDKVSFEKARHILEWNLSPAWAFLLNCKSPQYLEKCQWIRCKANRWRRNLSPILKKCWSGKTWSDGGESKGVAPTAELHC